jgi:deferrochelatase/peroxidase EfeB
VRRTHPRDASGIVEVSHRLLRRGMPYGPELKPEANEDDGALRGLYFVALNADLERQFEFVQRRWVNAPTGTGLDDDLDPLLGGSQTRPLRMVVPGTGPRPLPRVIDALTQFVEFRGGGYFFMPSLTALKALSWQDAAEARS